MNDDKSTLRSWRLASQQINMHPWQKPEQVVQWLGGVQAQNYAGGKWSIGLRTKNSTSSDVEEAIRNQKIIRTWMFRGTLHFIAAGDLGWLSSLLAPRIIKTNARRYKQLELDETSFRESQRVLQQAIQRDGPLTRAEIKAQFEREGVPAEGQQLPYLLQRAALDGVICHGPQRNNEPTYALLPDWVEFQSALDPEMALRRLAERYFASHGPATTKDFAWWAGMTISNARAALESSSLQPLNVEGDEFWIADDRPHPDQESDAYLLPPFDEFLLGYKDRSLVLDPEFTKRVNRGGGMLKPTLVVNGEVLGIWSYKMKKQEVAVSIHPFRTLQASKLKMIKGAADRFGRFFSTSVDLSVAPSDVT